jgi:four helix bundle protein
MQSTRVMAKKLEELPIFLRASEFCALVDAILAESHVRRNRKLYDQIEDANDSVLSNMQEGFEQGTDAAFASYLVHSKGSVGEIVTRVKRARVRRLVSEEVSRTLEARGDELKRMLAGFIRYLRECDWKDRGRHTRDNEPDDTADAAYGDGAAG